MAGRQERGRESDRNQNTRGGRGRGKREGNKLAKLEELRREEKEGGGEEGEIGA